MKVYGDAAALARRSGGVRVAICEFGHSDDKMVMAALVRPTPRAQQR